MLRWRRKWLTNMRRQVHRNRRSCPHLIPCSFPRNMQPSMANTQGRGTCSKTHMKRQYCNCKRVWLVSILVCKCKRHPRDHHPHHHRRRQWWKQWCHQRNQQPRRRPQMPGPPQWPSPPPGLLSPLWDRFALQPPDQVRLEAKRSESTKNNSWRRNKDCKVKKTQAVWHQWLRRRFSKGWHCSSICSSSHTWELPLWLVSAICLCSPRARRLLLAKSKDSLKKNCTQGLSRAASSSNAMRRRWCMKQAGEGLKHVGLHLHQKRLQDPGRNFVTKRLQHSRGLNKNGKTWKNERDCRNKKGSWKQGRN